jgi:predicted acyltransferase
LLFFLGILSLYYPTAVIKVLLRKSRRPSVVGSGESTNLRSVPETFAERDVKPCSDILKREVCNVANGNTSDDRSDFQQQRLHSLDAYRGLIMISLSFVGFGLAKTAGNHLKENPDSAFWQGVQYQFSHAQWVGCAFWDLIQPSFMFMVGVSMAYSYAKRQRLGHSYQRMLGHAIWRSIVLILLSIFLMSQWRDSTSWTFMNVLAQMGLAYPFLFLLWGRRVRTQALAATLILLATWVAYELYPNAGIDLTTGAPEAGVTKEWAEEHLEGVRASWHKNANIGHAIDLVVLNCFPRPEPFEFSSGGYQTINFIPSLVTMLFGLMCGELLRSGQSSGRKLLFLTAAGVSGLALGQLMNVTGFCPIVKRIWTPSWALFSGGWCCLILAGLYAVIDVLRWRRWSYPLIVVGMNSIVMYYMSMSFKPWTARQLQTHLGKDIFKLKTYWIDASSLINPAYEPTVQAVMVGLMLWLVCFYLYRHKIFIRI